ncbi:hypothetical protein [Roseinatronobacter alkalisoli]|uniref:Dynamin n=1 Tax=Roseinatronobacter alkalisoli TaxID=3028235 RepID=A0ABT5T6K1_9RHOB|nr:hypothetical protein [Roseinatronobacter sp. HJB301]MDD7970674.1 hypothetical protein [Roseinatronobacter sp. HJB301]
MAFIVGGVVVGLILLYLLFGGFGSSTPTSTSTAPAGSSTIINNDAGTGAAGTGAEGTAPAGDGATAPAAPEPATGAETAPAPLPAD